MTSNFKHLIALALLGAGLQTGVHAAPTFEHVKTLDFGTTITTPGTLRIVSTAATEDGTLYFSNNLDDKIHSIELFKPEYDGRDILTSDVNTPPLFDGSGISYSGNSFAGLALNPETGDLIGAGASNRYGLSGGSSIYRFSKSGATWTKTDLSLPTPAGLSGVEYLGSNRYAFTDAKSGSLYFYELNAEGTALNPIGNISGQTGEIWAPALAVDVDNGIAYQGLGDNRADKNLAGRVDKFTFNFVSGEFPFASGSYGFTGTGLGEFITGFTPTSGTDNNGSAPHVYQALSVNSTGQYLAVGHNPAGRGYSTIKNSVKVYDVTTNPPTLVATLDGSETPDNFGMYGEIKVYNTTFITYNGKEYLLTFFTQANAMTGTKPATLPYSKRVYTGYLYEVKETSDIETWEMY